MAEAQVSRSLRIDTRYAASWFIIATGALMLAGLFSLVPLIGRAPGFASLVTDPLFARRILVVHVNLALGVWLLAFVAGLFALIPARGRARTHDFCAVGLTLAGVMVMVGSALSPGAQPVMSNYVPAIDHPAFSAGLIMIGAGLLLAAFDRRLWPSSFSEHVAILPPEAHCGLRAGALGIVLAILTFIASWIVTPTDLEPLAYYERLFWGGGHVLQFVHVAGLMTAWIILLTRALDRPPVSRTTASRLFACLLAPLLVAPLIALRGTGDALYLQFFTRLMQFAIPLCLLPCLFLCARAVWRTRPSIWDPKVAAFGVSVLLTVLGMAIGSAIRGSNTVVPGHYHASIGAITVVYMALTVMLLDRFGMRLSSARLWSLATFQPLVFGLGQTVFAIGFALAGTAGMLRKTYGAEQHIRTVSELIGLSAMAAGGLVAIAGGLFFLYLIGAVWSQRLGSLIPLRIWAATCTASGATKPPEMTVRASAETI